MKEYVNPWDYAPHILKIINDGILLTTQADGEVDTMAIGWGTLGVQWKKTIFIVFVRQSRHTKTLLDQNPEFTVNIPLDKIDKDILRITGTMSGRDIDKIKEAGLTLVPG